MNTNILPSPKVLAACFGNCASPASPMSKGRRRLLSAPQRKKIGIGRRSGGGGATAADYSGHKVPEAASVDVKNRTESH